MPYQIKTIRKPYTEEVIELTKKRVIMAVINDAMKPQPKKYTNRLMQLPLVDILNDMHEAVWFSEPIVSIYRKHDGTFRVYKYTEIHAGSTYDIYCYSRECQASFGADNEDDAMAYATKLANGEFEIIQETDSYHEED